MQCALLSVKCALLSVQCAVFSGKCESFSFLFVSQGHSAISF